MVYVKEIHMTNEIEKINNIKKSCKIAATIVNIIRILIMVAMIITAVGAILCGIFSPIITDVMAQHPETVENSHLTIHFFGMVMTADGIVNSGIRVMLVCLLALVILLCAFVILHQVRKCFLILSVSETPFSEEVVATLKRAFIFVVIVTLVTTGLLAAGFMALVFWCIYNVFQYGCLLQQQADETL